MAAAAGLADAIRTVALRLEALGRPFALCGGLAVSVRSEPRFTRDVDLAVSVRDDADAEQLISDLGYAVLATVEQAALGRLATARLRLSAESPVIDLLFASSGIEAEIVQAAEALEVLEGLVVPVATRAHLLAMKLLSESDARPQDRGDILALLPGLSSADRRALGAALDLIGARGGNRGRDLHARLTVFESLVGPHGPGG